jgi:hypothetical protein
MLHENGDLGSADHKALAPALRPDQAGAVVTELHTAAVATSRSRRKSLDRTGVWEQHTSPAHPTRDELAALARTLESDLERLVASAADAVSAHVEAYRAEDNPGSTAALLDQCREVLAVLTQCLLQDRVPQPQDFTATGALALVLVTNGVGLAEFLKSLRLAQINLWNRFVPLLADASPAALSRAVYLLMQTIEVASSCGAEAHLEAEQFRTVDRDRLRADLVDDLLMGRPPVLGPRRAILEAGGLRDDAPFVVCALDLGGPTDDPGALGNLRDSMRAVLGRAAGGLVVARASDVVGVFPALDGGAAVGERIHLLHQEIGRTGTTVCVGISTVRVGWAGAPSAYREAVSARDGLGPAGGVCQVSTMSAMDYLALTEDDTARRLIDPRIRDFVEDELASGGQLLQTLEAYAAGHLNSRSAAERLGVHPNTAYYRLDRIAERTGRDLRSFPAVLDLLLAIRLLRGRRAATWDKPSRSLLPTTASVAAH